MKCGDSLQSTGAGRFVPGAATRLGVAAVWSGDARWQATIFELRASPQLLAFLQAYDWALSCGGWRLTSVWLFFNGRPGRATIVV